MFADIYGEHYSKASISRMLDYLRKDVTEWLERSLESYYPVVFIDCVHIKIHRKRSVDTEAFYVVLAVREDKTREVLGIFNKPTESALGWGEMLKDLYGRGVGRIGLICADGLRGLEDVISEVFPGTKLQRSTRGMSQRICGRCSVPGTGTILWSRHGASGRGSVPNGAGTTGASASEARTPPTRRISHT